jgi:hypothetical protein
MTESMLPARQDSIPSLEINYAMFTSHVSKDTCKDMNISNKSELIIGPERTQTTCNPLCTYRLMIHETKKIAVRR